MYRTIVIQAKNSSKVINEISTENEKRQYENELTKVFNDTKDQRSKLSSFFIYEDKIVDFIEKVEGIGLDSNTILTLSSINADDLSSAKSGSTGFVKAHITANGSWSSIMRALILIENLPYSLSLNNIRIDSSASADIPVGKEEAKKGKWNLSLDLKVIMMK